MLKGGGYNREEAWKDFYEESGERQTGETDFRGFAELFKERGLKGFNLAEKETSQPANDNESGRRYPANPQRSLDLHGNTVGEADRLLSDFITTSRELGLKLVIVVTGLGRNSVGGVSKLRPPVVQKLTAMIKNQQIRDFKTADPRHGGYGAIYVYLK